MKNHEKVFGNTTTYPGDDAGVGNSRAGRHRCRCHDDVHGGIPGYHRQRDYH